jgi:hypothetical protein
MSEVPLYSCICAVGLDPCGTFSLQGYLAHKNTHLPRTLP